MTVDTARPIPALCPSLRVPPRLNSSNTRDSVGRDARAVVTHSNAHLTIVAVDGQPHVSSVRACTPPRSAAPLRHRHAFSDDHTDVEPFAMQLERASKNLRHLGHIADEPRDVAPPRAVVAVRARASREKRRPSASSIRRAQVLPARARAAVASRRAYGEARQSF